MRKLTFLSIVLFCFVSKSNFAQVDQRIQMRNIKENKKRIVGYPPEWSYNANIYEVNIRQFTKEGTIKAFMNELPRLQEMGVKILWIMPVQPIGVLKRKGSLGSYYSIKDYHAVNPEMGTMEDFIFMVRQAHESGMKVILDWVANHTSFDHAWINSYPQNYTRNEAGEVIPPVEDWTDVADLDYSNPDVRFQMLEAMKFWVRATDLDGFRCDVANMVPLDFWQNTREELEKIKPLFMLAEAEEKEMHNKAFDMTYAFSQHHLMTDIAKGKKKVTEIDTYIQGQAEWPSDAFRMYFTSSHDENSWQGTEYERLGDGAQAFAVLTYGMNGMPMIYSGQESAFNRRLKFFEKDEIEWGNYPLAGFYRKLNELKSSHPALLHGGRGGEHKTLSNGSNDAVYSFVKDAKGKKIFFILNLSDKNQKIKINSDAIEGTYTELFSEKEVKFTSKLSLSLKPWQYFVYISKQ